jgi:hypothetical protein
MKPMSKKIIIILTILLFSGCSNPALDSWKADRLARSSQKSYDQAVRLYQKSLRHLFTSRKKDAIRLKLAKLYLLCGDYPLAIKELHQLDTPEGKRLLAQALFKNSDFTDALEVFNKIGDKGDAEYLYFYGLTLERNNLYDQALRIYSLIQKDNTFGLKSRSRIATINLNNGQGVFAGVDEEVKKIVRESPGEEKYPDASILYLLCDENVYLTEKDQLISDDHYVIKVINDRGKEAFGEVTLAYDSTYEKLELVYARTIKPDGTVVTVGEKNIRDVSLYMNFPLYSNVRARIISMPEVSVGSVIEYRVKTYQSQLPNKKDFNTAYWLQMDEPILWQRCRIDVPISRKLRYKIINGDYNVFGFDMTPKVMQKGNRVVYTLEFKNVPQIIPESSMPPMARSNPYILFSTLGSWNDIYTWWRDLYRDKIVADEAIKAKVRALTGDKKSPEEKLRAIYNFCAQEVRYVAVEYGDAGFEPHKATEIFANKYGDCKDKAVLLVAMLQAAGIEAFPVLISTQDSLDLEEDLPTLLFNHAITATKLGDKLVFMDVTANTVPFSDLPRGDQGRETLVFFKDHYELVKTPLFGPEHNRLFTSMKIKVNNDETIEAEREVTALGSYSHLQRYWLKFTMPTLIEEELKQRARGFADNATLKNYVIKNVDDLDRPILLKYTFSAPQYFIKAGPIRIMDQLTNIDTTPFFKEARRYPIEFPGLDLQEERIEIELPARFAVKYLPPPVEVETPWFYFVSQYEKADKHLIRYHFVHKTKEHRVEIKEYRAYKKSIEEIASLVNQHVVLEEK